MRHTDTGRGGRGDAVAPRRLFALLTPRPPEPGAPTAPAPATLPPSSPPSSLPATRGRWDLGVPGARALIAVGLVAALVAAGFLWLSRPRPQPVPAAAVRPALAAQPAMPSAVPSAAPAAAPALVVDVAGKVRRPGVVTLSPGARVLDAIKAAGGLRPGARAGTLNLARHVVDGEQILVGADAGAGAGAAAPPGGGPAPPGAGAAPGAAPGAQLDLNSATVQQFDQLPGVGPVLAQRIVDYRTQHGAFRRVDELQEVTGIGGRRYADIKDLVRV